jgi:putative peptidoglycan lipid II flippase
MKFNDRHAIGKSAAIVGLFSLFADLAALVRDRLFAVQFGAGHLLDAYYAAFRVPDFVYNLLILGTLSVAFIPVFTEHLVNDEEEARKIANTVLTIATGTIAVCCFILYFFVPQLIHHVIAPGFTGQSYVDTVILTKLFLLSPIIFTASSVFGSVLNSLNRFLMVAIAPVLYNIGIMIGILAFYPHFGIRGLAYGVLVGALLHLLTQIIGAAFAGYRYRPKFSLGHAGVRKVFKLLLPRILGIDNSLFTSLIASYLGSFLAAGSIAVFSFAINLNTVPLGIFALSFATASFPNLSEHFARKDEESFNKTLSQTAVNILYFMIPSSVLLIVLRLQIVRVIYGGGSFDSAAVHRTGLALGIAAASLFAQSLTALLARAFYARQNTVIPVVSGLVTLIVNAGVAYCTFRHYGVAGLAFGFTASAIVNALLLMVFLKPRLQSFNIRPAAIDSLKIMGATAVLAMGTYFGLHLVSLVLSLTKALYVLVQGGIAGVIGIVIYLALTKALGMNQSQLAVNLVRRRLLRK